jgi:uncharacterized alkaline shock family protein YloU
MVDKEIPEEKVVDQALGKITEIKKAAGDFRENVASLLKDMNVTSNDWHFNVESHEKGVIVDVAVKLLLTKKEVDVETHK